MANWSSIGAQVKTILESTFDGVAASYVTFYKPPNGTAYTLKAMVSIEPLRLNREHYVVNDAGISDLENLRFAFKTADLSAIPGGIDPAGYFRFNGVRYDFSQKFPGHSKEMTPMIGAEDTFTLCYVRRAEELTHSTDARSTGDKFKFGDW